jgi:hypothetical protein
MINGKSEVVFGFPLLIIYNLFCLPLTMPLANFCYRLLYAYKASRKRKLKSLSFFLLLMVVGI